MRGCLLKSGREVFTDRLGSAWKNSFSTMLRPSVSWWAFSACHADRSLVWLKPGIVKLVDQSGLVNESIEVYETRGSALLNQIKKFNPLEA